MKDNDWQREARRYEVTARQLQRLAEALGDLAGEQAGGLPVGDDRGQAGLRYALERASLLGQIADLDAQLRAVETPHPPPPADGRADGALARIAQMHPSVPADRWQRLSPHRYQAPHGAEGYTICAVVAFGETMSRDTRTGNEAEAFTELFQRAADWAAHRVACEDGTPVLRPYDRDFPTNAGSCVWCGKLPTEHIPRPAPVGIGDLYRALDEYLNAPYDVEAGLKELKARIVDEQHRVRPATLGVTREYPCPECGHDGPHPVVDQAADGVTCECVGCLAEFQIPAGG